MKRRKKLSKKNLAIFISVTLLLIFAVVAFYAVSQLEKEFYPREYSKYVSKYCKEYNIPQDLVYAVILNESNFDSKAESAAGAKGLMQLMPDTYEWVSKNLLKEPEPTGDIFDPETNIKYGTYYLRYLKDRFDNWETVIAAYNAGHNRVASWLEDSRYSNDGKTLKSIPISETRNYVEKVMASQKEYADIYHEKED